ncbi:hypothetical protein E2320_011879, partial [Naja naja]
PRTSSLCKIDPASTNINAARDLPNPTKISSKGSSTSKLDLKKCKKKGNYHQKN